jgi:two-component system phosphate regulon sensor histidine kinase PhoR
MKLTTRNFRIIAALSVAALTGLIVLQYLLLRNAYEFRQQAFERNVYAAMSAMAQKLETGEAARSVFRVAMSAPRTGDGLKMVTIDADSVQSRSLHDSLSLMLTSTAVFDEAPLRMNGNELQYEVRRPQHVTLELVDVAGGRDTMLVDTFRQAGKYTVRVGDARALHGEVMVRYFCDSNSVVMRTMNGGVQALASGASVGAKRKEILGRAFDNLSVMEREPITRRVRAGQLDSVVDGTLKEAGIDIPYAYALLTGLNDSLGIAKPAGFEPELRSSIFRTRLFPNDLFSSDNALALFFPGRNTYLLWQMAPFLVLSVLFTMLIVMCFAYTMLTIVRQKEFSVRLVDFINNMTHEFKTPISTIAVAAETIARPEVLEQKEKILRYSAVIQDENSRMKKQVDKILQMAVLEEGDYELAVADLDVHDVVRKAVGNVALQVEAKGGTITSRLDALRPVVRGDAVHLTNMIHSVLDNANKYSPEAPVIEVTSSDDGAYLLLEVADHGIGIAPDDQKRVFEKYFRVHTGNVHDVKGFGLGLSYVKLMAEAHGGRVSLESALEKGTVVRLRLPVAGKEMP